MPILTLPPELLTEIFLWAATFADFQRVTREAPLNVSHTCKAWRQLVLTKTCFWTRFEPDHDVSGQLVLMWLERTGNATITYDTLMIVHRSKDHVIPTWHRELGKRQSQWGNMGLFYPHPDKGRRAVQTFPLEDLRNLTSWFVSDYYPFTIRYYKSRTAYKQLFLVPDLSSTGQPIAPRLTTLQITDFFADRVQHKGLLAMLRHSPNLEAFRLDFCLEKEDSRLSESTEICVLSKLRQLTLRGSFTRLHLFKNLRAPALDSLNVMYTSGLLGMSGGVPTLISDFKLGPSMRKLVLDVLLWPVDGDTQRLLFEALPDLSYLYIKVPELTYVCGLLSLAPDGPGLCPRLDELRMCFYQPPDIDVLGQMLSSRFESNEKFRVSIRDDKRSRYKNIEKELLDTNPSFREWNESGRLQVYV